MIRSEMCSEFHQGQKLPSFIQRPDICVQLFLCYPSNFLLAMRGSPYMSPEPENEVQNDLDTGRAPLET